MSAFYDCNFLFTSQKVGKKKKKHLEKVENAAPQIFGFFSQRVK